MKIISIAIAYLLLIWMARAEGESQCQLDASKAYIKALVSHDRKDADAVPLEDDVLRFEGPPGNLKESANGANNLRDSLVNGMSAKTVYQALDEKYTTLNKTTVEVLYTIKIGLGNGFIPMGTARIDEFFVFKSAEACKIHRIDVSFEMGKRA